MPLLPTCMSRDTFVDVRYSVVTQRQLGDRNGSRMDPVDRAALARFRDRKLQLEAELQALSLIIDGFEALEAMQSAHPSGRSHDATRFPAGEEDDEDIEASTGGMAPVDPDVHMTARDATLRIYRERPGAYRAGHIAEEIRRRGWVIDSTNPEQAVRTALLRLVEAGELQRIAHGLYDVAEQSDASSPSLSNGSPDHRDSPNEQLTVRARSSTDTS